MHLLSLYAKQPCVQPVFCQRLLSGQSLGLRYLCFVMWKDQFGPPSMKIIRAPEIRECYRSVFNVPAGSSFAPWAVPGNLTGFLALPEDEVARVSLFRVRIDPVNCQLFQVLPW